MSQLSFLKHESEHSSEHSNAIKSVKVIQGNESYKKLVQDISEQKEKLLAANNEELIHIVLNDLKCLMISYSKNSQLADISSIVNDILTMITSVQIHDITRVDLGKTLDLLIEAANKIIGKNGLKLEESLAPIPHSEKTNQSEASPKHDEGSAQSEEYEGYGLGM